MKEKPVKITVLLDPDVASRLEAYASGQRRSRSNAVAVMIEDALNGAPSEP
jgi:hypothetical protein